jgi:hypothetical protein
MQSGSTGRPRRGHSLLEILVAAAIIALLAGLIGMALVKIRHIVLSFKGVAVVSSTGAATRSCAV